MVKVTGKQVKEFVEANGREAIAEKVTEFVAQLSAKIIENTLNSLKSKPKLQHRYFAIMNYETGAIKFCEGELPIEVDEEEWLIEHHAYSDSSMYYMSSDEPIEVEYE